MARLEVAKSKTTSYRLLVQVGCDSIVTLSLTQISLGVGLELEESATMKLGEAINLSPSYYDDSYT